MFPDWPARCLSIGSGVSTGTAGFASGYSCRLAFDQRGVERALLIGSWMLVIVVEMVNSAIEAAIDRIGNERHELSRKAKDFGSAAVFCSIVLSVAVWILVLVSG